MSDEGWSEWMGAVELAEMLGTSTAPIYKGASDSSDDRFQKRKAPSSGGRSPRYEQLYQYRARLDAQVEKQHSIRHLNPATAALVCDEWMTAKRITKHIGVDPNTVYPMVKSGRMLRRARNEYRVPYWKVVGEWRSISYLAELLDLPRTNLERRLFERGTVESLQWAHYLVRPFNGPGAQKWECRIHYNYGPEPLTRDDIEDILKDSTFRSRP